MGQFLVLKACTLAGEFKLEVIRVIQQLIRATGPQRRAKGLSDCQKAPKSPLQELE